MGSHIENKHCCARSRYNQKHLLERDNLDLLRRLGASPLFQLKSSFFSLLTLASLKLLSTQYNFVLVAVRRVPMRTLPQAFSDIH